MNKKELRRLVRWALVEDVGKEDLTTNLTVDADLRCNAELIAKCDGVLSGVEAFRMVFEVLKGRISDWQGVGDGGVFQSGDTLATFSGLARPLLTGERTALNFIQRLSGVATLTAAYVDAVKGSRVRICDTRKTTPLFRVLEKEAVGHGGGSNHRMALYDGVLIKENHIVAAGGITEAIRKARGGIHHLMRIGIEVTKLVESKKALKAGADLILLDNMSCKDMREAVAVAVANQTGVILEASGNAALDNVQAMADTGVDIISVGALTHSAMAIDLSLILRGLT